MTNKHLAVFLSALLVAMAASACDSATFSLFAEATPSPTAVRNVLATVRPKPSLFPLPAAPTEAPTPVPQVFPTQTEAAVQLPAANPTAAATTTRFCCLHFAPGPFGGATETFPAGTEIVYAVWDYAALQPGDRIRRIWIRDDLIWIAREEDWDWENYGAAGTVRDLSIFDYEGSGLQPGAYRLQLYINDALQQEGAFAILPP